MSAATTRSPATIPSRMETSASPCDSPAVVNRSIGPERERRTAALTTPGKRKKPGAKPGFFRSARLRTRRGEGVGQLSDDNSSGRCPDQNELSRCLTICRLDRTDDRIANRNRRDALVAVRVEDLDQWLRRRGEQ